MTTVPQHLSDEAKQWWVDLHNEYSLDDPGGLLLLQTACEAFERMRDAQNIIKKEGATIKDRFEQIKAHPMLTVERDARSQMIQSLKALNLDVEPLRDSVGRPPGS